MSAWLGIPLALAALFGGGWLLGWKGVVLALTAIVFWLLLQFSRLMRLMQRAGSAPLGRVESAVMLQAKLREGMKLAELLAVSGSLGERVEGQSGCYRWRDAGGAWLDVQLERGRVRRWQLQRAEDATPAA